MSWSVEEKRRGIETYLYTHHEFKLTYRDSEQQSTCYESPHLQLCLSDDLQRWSLVPLSGAEEAFEQQEAYLHSIVTDRLAIMRLLVEWYEQHLATEVPGFSDTDEDTTPMTTVPLLPELVHTASRPLSIYVWGANRRKHLPVQVDRNFNAAVLHGKKAGVDWRRDGRTSEVREAVMKADGFIELMIHIVETIEKNDYTRIGVNCKAGRHRSVSIAICLQQYYYSHALLYFLELR